MITTYSDIHRGIMLFATSDPKNIALHVMA